MLADREAVNGPEHHGTVATRNGLAKWQREAAAAASDTDGETAADDW
ncbi:hypothetical protein SCOCK_70023 [Actinacidiphila cocklensis]|uniref:Uncharacterized protein n=1 Tax=Actinacidiphila cocklensis TaxID=887465 RepID=A0A9W4GUN1_9ACTN|nr:hypothetical protein SCOCK_70023 [Actinacidiphila cocklensis]